MENLWLKKIEDNLSKKKCSPWNIQSQKSVKRVKSKDEIDQLNLGMFSMIEIRYKQTK